MSSDKRAVTADRYGNLHEYPVSGNQPQVGQNEIAKPGPMCLPREVTGWVLRRGGIPPETGVVWRGLNFDKILGKDWSHDLRS